MFAARYFAPRHYANRYFPPVGADVVAGSVSQGIAPQWHRRRKKLSRFTVGIFF